MADKKITELTELSSASLADIFAVVDIAGSETKKITNESYITNVRNHESPLTASGVVISDNLIPKFPSGSSLGSLEKPFAELYLQSGSITIESDTPGDPSAVISNVSGNLEISVGGMLLVEQDASFIAPTGSFSYLSGSFYHVGAAERLGDTIITGSVDITGSFTASLTNEHVWIGDENNRSTEISASGLATYLTESFITPEQTGSFVQSSYFSGYSSSSITLSASGSEQVLPFTSIWTQNGISLVDNTKFTFAEAGVYKFELLTSVLNNQTTEYDAWFWIKLNGTNFPNSTVKVTIQKQKGSGEHAHELVAISILGVAQNPNDYIQLYWTGENTNLSMVAENGNEVYPESPSVSLNIIRVG